MWDDGSTDDTLSIVNKFKDKRIKIFESDKNYGLGKSRLSAIKKLNGELISILDADDHFEKEKIKKQVDVFIKFPEVSICSTWANFYDKKKESLYSFQTDNDELNLKTKLLYINFLPHSSIMYRKKNAEQVGWYSNQLEYSQDYDLTLKLLENNRLYVIKEYLTNILQSETNMTNLKRLKSLIFKENIILLEKNLKKTSSNSTIKLIKDSIKINQIKLHISDFKKNSLTSLYFLIKILILNPFLIFKLKSLQKLDERKKKTDLFS